MANEPLASGISLNTAECSDHDTAIFVPLFKQVWTSLPDLVQKVLCAHWHNKPGGPLIQLLPFKNNPGEIEAGQVRARGHEIRFNLDLFAFMPDWCGTTAIAHEIGHVLFLATGEHWHAKPFEMPGMKLKYLSCELINHQLVRLWDYRQDEFINWINCEVSSSGGPNVETKDERLKVSAGSQNELAAMRASWGQLQGIEGQENIDDAYDKLIRSTEPFYRMATTGGAPYDSTLEKGLGELGNLLKEECRALS